jgi:2-hydroxychromene-2-carboxylate isomerase
VDSPAGAFFFDLASPEAYLVAERILHVLDAPVQWRPLLARDLQGGAPGADSRESRDQQARRRELERRARALGLQPLRWPDPFPFDSALAMRAAAYAASIGRAVPFAQAAFRQAFAGGRALVDADSVVIAAAACEMHPAAVLRAQGTRAVARELARNAAEACALGVREVPAIALGEHVFAGERALERAAAWRTGDAVA